MHTCTGSEAQSTSGYIQDQVSVTLVEEKRTAVWCGGQAVFMQGPWSVLPSPSAEAAMRQTQAELSVERPSPSLPVPSSFSDPTSCPFYTWGFVSSSFSASWQADQLAGALGSVLTEKQRDTSWKSSWYKRWYLCTRLFSRICLGPLLQALSLACYSSWAAFC